MWNEKQVEVLKELWGEGQSARQIAARLGGVTGPAVDGKVRRMGLPGHGGGWTEGRTKTLTKLWADGLSASRIAVLMGGITRNAVIGRVHRLGLPGRKTMFRAVARRSRARRQPRPSLKSPGNAGQRRGGAVTRPIQYELPFPPLMTAINAPALVRPPIIEMTIRAPMRVKLLDLKECMCRWPIGDPQSRDFHFCGQRKTAGSSYCAHHARIGTRREVRK